jgi:hypothetical protein
MMLPSFKRVASPMLVVVVVCVVCVVCGVSGVSVVAVARVADDVPTSRVSCSDRSS